MFKSHPTFGLSRLATPAGVIGALALTLLLSCAPPPPGRVYIVRRPPPERVEVIGAGPGPGFVYVRGYWRYDGNDFVWTPGRWVSLDRRYRQWVPGHWAHDRHGWYWVEGRWR
jgi:WXXGXW repeat (2 copies)